MKTVKVIGAGLAGCEAAWQLSIRGIDVQLFEMKPVYKSPAHKSDFFAELVCSNSLRGAGLTTAPGLLKEELRRVGSLILQCADQNATPAGGALAVDREGFAKAVTERIKSRPNIEIISQRVESVPQGNIIIASGPLTDGHLAESIKTLCGNAQQLHFYDAAAPVIATNSIDMEQAYLASRYDKGTADYINCPMEKEEYLAFIAELCIAEEAPVHGFEDKKVFEGCMPVEVMARRGEETLRFGPMKPVGLRNPQTGHTPYAVVQLRADNKEGTMYNMVGFQTHLKFPEQKRVFGMIPALKNAEFLRYGVMHRNSYINSPQLLDEHYRLKSSESIYFAGQITGVEGYIESTASGLCAGLDMALRLLNREQVDFPQETALGALCGHVSRYEGKNFQPMNINFGIITPLGVRIKGKQERYATVSQRALEELDKLLPKVFEEVNA